MFRLVTIACILGFILSQTSAFLILRFASQNTGFKMVAIFLIGTTIGTGSPICMTIALRNSNPNLIYAACIGGSFFVLQVASSFIFRNPLTGMQWAGVLLVGSGLLLLPMSRNKVAEAPDVKPIDEQAAEIE